MSADIDLSQEEVVGEEAPWDESCESFSQLPIGAESWTRDEEVSLDACKVQRAQSVESWEDQCLEMSEGQDSEMEGVAHGGREEDHASDPDPHGSPPPLGTALPEQGDGNVVGTLEEFSFRFIFKIII